MKTNSSFRQFFAALSKTADSKAVSVTRAEVMCRELIVEQNLLGPDDTLTKAMKLMFPDSRIGHCG